MNVMHTAASVTKQWEFVIWQQKAVVLCYSRKDGIPFRTFNEIFTIRCRTFIINLMT